jgi:hypothetical protein
MRWWTRFRRWLRRKRWERQGNSVLREFVYLDEVSVYSLLASRSGPVATEFTQTESESLKDESTSGLAANAGPVKGELGSRLEGTQTVGSQVVRKASAQARFKQLLDDEQDEMLLRAEPRTKRPKIRDLTALGRLAADGKSRDWILDAAQLRRGDLLELEVELAAEEIYEVDQTMSSLLSILQEDPQAFGVGNSDALRYGMLMTRVLDALLVGLVPIRARVVSHMVVRRGNDELLVRKELLQDVDTAEFGENGLRPLYVVGVTEIGLFWKDVRRILFSRNRYLTLFRLGQDGLPADWTPIKLIDVLSKVLPSVAGQLDSTGRGLLSALRESQSADGQSSRAEQMNQALLLFTDALASGDVQVTVDDLAEAGLLLEPQMPFVDTTEGRRELFAKVKQWLDDRTGTPIDAERAALARSEAVLEAFYIQGPTPESEAVAGGTAGAPDGPCLDSEIIAVYW